MVAVGVGAVATWLGYSLMQRHHLNKGDFLAMQLLAETRRPYGDPSSVIPKLSALPTVSKLPSDQNIKLLAGDDDADADTTANDAAGPIYKCGDTLYCQPTRNQTSYSLFGCKPRIKQSLRQLVQKHSRKMQVYEDLETRYSYMRGIRQAQPMVVNASSVFKGAYSFCFRDYVNFEEMLGMMIRRRGIEMLLFKLMDSTKLTVDDELNCHMKDTALFLMGIPLQISWYGKLEMDRINWTSTSMRLGWKRFGKTFLNPKSAEKLRQDPWVVRLPKEDCNPKWAGSGDIVVLDRLNSGSLVFCRPECLKPL